MNRIKNLILGAGLAACAAISLAAVTPASAGPIIVYYTNFNGAPTGTQAGLTPLAWTNGIPVNGQNDWGSTPNSLVANATLPVASGLTPGTQYVDLDSTFQDLGASVNSPTFSNPYGAATFTLTADIWNPSSSPSSALLEAAAAQPSTSVLSEAFTTPVPSGYSVEKISWVGTPSDFSFAIGDLGTSPLDLESVELTVAPVPEASTVIGFGVMLALGGLFLFAPRKRSKSSTLAI